MLQRTGKKQTQTIKGNIAIMWNFDFSQCCCLLSQFKMFAANILFDTALGVKLWRRGYIKYVLSGKER